MAGAFLSLLAIGPVIVEDYRAHAITMIVPFPAGGATDTLARVLGERMRAIWGQPVIMEHVGGAAGTQHRTSTTQREPGSDRV